VSRGPPDEPVIRTADRRLRVFVSSTLGELADERRAVSRAIEALRLTPVMFELGARPYPPREVYQQYLAQSDVFIGLYWQRYGQPAPRERDPQREERLRPARETMADVLDGSPEFVDLSVVEEWAGKRTGTADFRNKRRSRVSAAVRISPRMMPLDVPHRGMIEQGLDVLPAAGPLVVVEQPGQGLPGALESSVWVRRVRTARPSR
jgi:hypothetical protein